jgi:hypothetical protein
VSVNDDGKNCHDCRQLRIERKAHRIMPSGAAVCEEHWRSRMGLPQRTSEAVAIVKSWQAPKSSPPGETEMAKKPEQDTIDGIRKDAAAGMNTNQISEKHSVTWATAKKYSAEGGGQDHCQTKNKNEWSRRSERQILQHDAYRATCRRDLGHAVDREEIQFAAAA